MGVIFLLCVIGYVAFAIVFVRSVWKREERRVRRWLAVAFFILLSTWDALCRKSTNGRMHNHMLNRYLLTSLILILPAISLADEYILIMSKENRVCQEMLLLYNEDLSKYRDIQYGKHEEYVRWEKRIAYIDYKGVKEKEYMLMSIFDINNDGKDEVIIKWTGSLRGYSVDSLHIFAKKDLELFANEFNVNILRRQIGNIGIDEPFKNHLYYLTEMPSQLVSVMGKKNEMNYTVGPLLSLNPFKFNGKYYIEMRDDTDNPKGTKFLIVFQYVDSKKLKDICYYHKSVDCKRE